MTTGALASHGPLRPSPPHGRDDGARRWAPGVRQTCLRPGTAASMDADRAAYTGIVAACGCWAVPSEPNWTGRLTAFGLFMRTCPIHVRGSRRKLADGEAADRSAGNRCGERSRMTLDVLIITALLEEVQALLSLRDGDRSLWTDERDPAGFLYHLRTFPLRAGEELRVAAAWSGAMGETAAADRCRGLTDYLEPLALAMCGMCAGRRGDVFLGDVIVADRVFSYDHGKLIASTREGRRVAEICRDIETYNLEKAWAMDAAYFVPESPSQKRLTAERPVSLSSQAAWLLRSVYAHQLEGAEAPQSHPERSKHCRDWAKALDSLQRSRLVAVRKGQLQVASKGRQKVLEERLRHVDGVPPDPPFRIHVGPIATGKTVRQDPDIFRRLAKFERKILGLEMEAAAIGFVAERSGIPSIIAKAVSDYGDAEKDDGFRQFACRASAEFLLAFLSRHPPKTLKRNKALRVSGKVLETLPQQVAAEVLNSLLASGITVRAPKGSPHGSLFSCETKGRGRVIGAALNNSGLLAYVGPPTLSRVVSLDRKQEYSARQIDIAHRFISFAVVDGPTLGLIPSYLRQDEVFQKDWATFSWLAFDREGRQLSLKLHTVEVLIKVDVGGEEVWLDDMMLATTEFGDGDILGGPVLSRLNELVGFAVASSTTSSAAEGRNRFVVIWPWVSLENALRQAKVRDRP